MDCAKGGEGFNVEEGIYDLPLFLADSGVNGDAGEVALP